LLHQGTIHVPQAVVEGAETTFLVPLAEILVVRAVAMEVVEQWRHDDNQHQYTGPRLREMFTQIMGTDP
jgi:hypothetical protein